MSDPHARYFGGELSERTLVPNDDARLGETRYENWFKQIARQFPNTNLQSAAGVGQNEHRVTVSKPMLVLAFLITGILIVTGTLKAQKTATPPVAQEAITPLMSKDLAEFPGKEIVMYTVEFPSGFSTPIHRHNAYVSVYMLEGSVVMQVRGGKEVTLTPGQSFYEGPDDIHVVSRNASSTKPAKFLVFLLKDKGAPQLVLTK
jgi:quercetin dioxygenase-like cupin family protein